MRKRGIDSTATHKNNNSFTMKLHLPKALFTAVVAACSVAYAADQWDGPTYGGPEYTWTGLAGDNKYETVANWKDGKSPDRANSNGPVLIYNNTTATVTGGGGVDTSDRGGIKVTGNSVVTSTIGRWAGAIYVEEGSVLTTDFSQSMKNTCAENVANVYAGGKLTITNEGILHIDDNGTGANAWQNWQIDTNGSIDISSATSVSKYGTWNLQYLKDDYIESGIADESALANRYREEFTFTHQIISSGFALNSALDSVTVIDKATGNKANDGTYTLTYGESGGLTVSYTATKINAETLETSGDITWAHGVSGWTKSGADDTDTSFLNGDTVKLVGDGTATLQGNVRVSDLSINEGVDYTINLTDSSSLSIDAKKALFAGVKVTGGSNTELNLNITADTSHLGDGRIILKEGSSVGKVNVNGIFAYNENWQETSSNLGGADLHLSGESVLLMRNGITKTDSANIGDIYFDEKFGTIQTYGTVSSSEIADNIYASSTVLKKTDGGNVTLKGTVEAKTLAVQGGSLELAGNTTISERLLGGGGNINITGTVTTSQLRLSEGAESTATISEGGKLIISGTTNDHSINDSVLLAHNNYASSLVINGGELAAADVWVRPSWTGTGTIDIQAGLATVKGISFWGENYTVKGHLILGSEEAGSGRLNIGTEGIKDVGGDNVSVTFGNGTIGAFADWRIRFTPNTTPKPVTVQFIGNEGGTVFDTTDVNDATVARNITIEVPIGGNGKLVKTGIGTLEVQGATTDFSGTIDVQKGLVNLSGSENLTLTGLSVAEGAEFAIGAQAAGTVAAGKATLAGGATVSGNLDLSNTTTLTIDGIKDKVVAITGVLSLSPSDSLTLSGDVLDAIAGLAAGEKVDIFSTGSLTLNTPALYSEEPTQNQWAIADIFRGNTWEQGNQLYVGYEAGLLYVINNAQIPEPTTATLSLLALAALASRRRRN